MDRVLQLTLNIHTYDILSLSSLSNYLKLSVVTIEEEVVTRNSSLTEISIAVLTACHLHNCDPIYAVAMPAFCLQHGMPSTPLRLHLHACATQHTCDVILSNLKLASSLCVAVVSPPGGAVLTQSSRRRHLPNSCILHTFLIFRQNL